MTKIGVRKVYFYGSNGFFERLVWRDNTSGKYYIRWYYETVEVIQVDGCEGSSIGWRTIEAY